MGGMSAAKGVGGMWGVVGSRVTTGASPFHLLDPSAGVQRAMGISAALPLQLAGPSAAGGSGRVPEKSYPVPKS